MDMLRSRLNNNVKNAECNNNLKCKISFSLGMIYYNPEKPCFIEELLNKADSLMYMEKESLRKKNTNNSLEGKGDV